MRTSKEWKEKRQDRIKETSDKILAIEKQKASGDNSVWKMPQKMPGKDTTYSSIWLSNPLAEQVFKDRLSEEGLSEFNPFVAKSIINYWSNPGDYVLDPFAGRTRGIVAALIGRKYFGFEISGKAYNAAMEEINKFNLDAVIYNEDAKNIRDHYWEKPFDLICSCPPYWNLEEYESCSGQLSDIKDYKTFLSELADILQRAVDVLKPEGYAAFVVGDFRKNGEYILFHKDFIQIAKEIGLKIHDIIILQNVQFGVALHRFGATRDLKTTGKCHEYLLIFKKPKSI